MSNNTGILKRLGDFIMSGISQNRNEESRKIDGQIPDRQRDWILALLHAPDKDGEKNQPICGKNNIVQSLFLIHERLEELEDNSPFSYTKSKYGPVDATIKEELENLLQKGRIKQEKSNCSNDRMESYSLTSEAERDAEKIYESLPEDVQKLLKWVRRRHTTSPLGELRAYLYSEDPGMFDWFNFIYYGIYS